MLIKRDSLSGIVSDTTTACGGKHNLPNVAEIGKSVMSVPYVDTEQWHSIDTYEYIQRYTYNNHVPACCVITITKSQSVYAFHFALLVAWFFVKKCQTW